MYVALGADGRAMSVIGSELRMNCCTGAPVMESMSRSAIVPRSLSTCFIVHVHRKQVVLIHADDSESQQMAAD